jgi:hypothetical protein
MRYSSFLIAFFIIYICAPSPSVTIKWCLAPSTNLALMQRKKSDEYFYYFYNPTLLKIRKLLKCLILGLENVASIQTPTAATQTIITQLKNDILKKNNDDIIAKLTNIHEFYGEALQFEKLELPKLSDNQREQYLELMKLIKVQNVMLISVHRQTRKAIVLSSCRGTIPRNITYIPMPDNNTIELNIPLDDLIHIGDYKNYFSFSIQDEKMIFHEEEIVFEDDDKIVNEMPEAVKTMLDEYKAYQHQQQTTIKYIVTSVFIAGIIFAFLVFFRSIRTSQ